MCIYMYINVYVACIYMYICKYGSVCLSMCIQLNKSTHIVFAEMGPVGVWLPGWSHCTGLPAGPLCVPGAGYHSQRAEPAHALPLYQQHCRLVFAGHLRMPFWPHPHLRECCSSSSVIFFQEAVTDQRCALLCHCDAVQSTTIILWVPLIVMSAVEMVFSFRCFAVCASFLYLCPCRRKPLRARRVRATLFFSTCSVALTFICGNCNRAAEYS